MGRRKHQDEIERTLITIPTSVMTQVRLMLMDPFTQQMKYGALSNLTTQLYREWIEKQQRLLREAKERNSVAPSPVETQQ